MLDFSLYLSSPNQQFTSGGRFCLDHHSGWGQWGLHFSQDEFQGLHTRSGFPGPTCDRGVNEASRTLALKESVNRSVINTMAIASFLLGHLGTPWTISHKPKVYAKAGESLLPWAFLVHMRCKNWRCYLSSLPVLSRSVMPLCSRFPSYRVTSSVPPPLESDIFLFNSIQNPLWTII